MSYGYIRQLGVIYHKYYYNYPNLESEQFCSYNHSEIFVTSMPNGFFLHDIDQKTIDKCYSSCKKCINYGNDNNHSYTKCFSGF